MRTCPDYPLPTDVSGSVIWTFERDTKVDEADLVWPVIVHVRGSMAPDAPAILTEVEAA